MVLDCRSPEAFAGGHIPRAMNVGLSSSFATWAGTVLPPDDAVLLVLDEPDDLWEASWQLLRIGYGLPAGWLAGGMAAWRASGKDVQILPEVSVHELSGRLERGELNVLDVRQPAEWASGHIDGAVFITGAELPRRIEEVPGDKPVAVVCGSGYRSSVAASLLASKGRGDVWNVVGGMSAWKGVGYPAEQ